MAENEHMLVTSALTGGGGDTAGQKSSSSFTPFLQEPRINNSSLLFMGMQNTKKGRVSQWLERPAVFANRVWHISIERDFSMYCCQCSLVYLNICLI